jgi:hypothetical protein
MLDRLCRMVEVYCSGFDNLSRELIESSNAASRGGLVDATGPVLQKVWTVFVEQCEDRFRNDHGNQLAEYLLDAEEVKKNLAEPVVRAGAEVARSDAVNSLASNQLKRAKAAISAETQRAAAAKATAAEAERLRLKTRLEADTERIRRVRAEIEVKDLSLLPVKMSEQARRMWELTVNADNLAERLEAAQHVREQGDIFVESANKRIARA